MWVYRQYYYQVPCMYVDILTSRWSTFYIDDIAHQSIVPESEMGFYNQDIALATEGYHKDKTPQYLDSAIPSDDMAHEHSNAHTAESGEVVTSFLDSATFLGNE